MRTKIAELFRIPSMIRAMTLQMRALETQIEDLRRSIGDVAERQLGPVQDWKAAEFRISSQWGEDGLLSYLLHHLPGVPESFVEFGVENYREANTRWLLQRRNWRGMVIDGSETNVKQIRADQLYWKHQLTVVQAFVTAENIDDLLESGGFAGEIGLLSIDIDGVDYWVWKAITRVHPAIVVVEYNSLFGPERSVTVPYRADFVRSRAHSSHSYYGASLAALVKLGREKGFSFVGSNSAGNNAFFVRHELVKPPLRELTAAEGYVKRGFREARDAQGRLTFPTFAEEAASVANLPLVEV